VDIAAELRELARNLYWTWHPEVIALFLDLDAALWRQVNHNPVEFLSRTSPERLAERAQEMGLEARINFAVHRLEEYLKAEHTWGAFHAGCLRARPVAYFAAEFGVHESLPIYSGGLGVLAGDHLKSASDLGVPLVGVGLFYAQGYFSQEIDRDGRQTERYFESDVSTLPLDRAMGKDGRPLHVIVRTRSSEIALSIWSAQVGRGSLVLLDSDVEENSREDRQLTATLYGGDERIRIRQELVLGVGGMEALEALGISPGVIHLNEGHSTFAALALARRLMERDGRPFSEVREQAAAMTVFTTHTPVEAGHDRFRPALAEETLGPLRESLGLSQQDFLALGRVDPADSNEPFCPTVVGMKMSRSIKAVSALHARVTRAMWRRLWPDLPVSRVPIGHVTNGVHVASWLAMGMERLFRRYLRQGWQERICYPETWTAVAEVDDLEFWEQQQMLKAHLVNYVRRCLRRQYERRGETDVSPELLGAKLGPATLTIGLARRFATYKRADLLLTDLNRLDKIVNDPERPVQIIYAGKAHPADEPAKALMQRVFQVTRDPRFAGKIVFIENHDINVSRHLVQGVDLWLNCPRRPLEACGTSGQKVLLNGGLNMSVLDGWWAEAYDGTNGFAIGEGGEHSDPRRQDERDLGSIFEVLEKQVVPLYYERDEKSIPRGWVACQKKAIQRLAWRYNADRMVMDYTLGCYLPAAGGTTSA
jgi:starch phosphorylase